MDEMKLTLYMRPRTKKNSMRIGRMGFGGRGRPILIQSPQYIDFENEALKLIPPGAKLGIREPVNVREVFYMDTLRRVDASNLQAAIDDILVKAGVLADDNRDVIAAHDGSRVYLDRQNPRIEITITPLNEEYVTFEQLKRPRLAAPKGH